jgi:hypothetical protein
MKMGYDELLQRVLGSRTMGHFLHDHWAIALPDHGFNRRYTASRKV